MSYNLVGMIVERVEKRLNETNTFTYTYDNANQLVEVFKNGTIINSYTYDDNGNRLSETTLQGVVNGRYDNQDRMSAYGSNVYSYTDRGSLKQKITSEGTTTYNYDFQGNLLTVNLPTKNIEYIVDARNRRIAKKVNGIVTQKFLYLNQLEPIAELDANDNIVSLFIYGTRSNTPEYIIKNNIKYKVVTNQLGSVILVVNVSSGEIIQSIEYDSFGNILSDSNPNFQPFTLAGGIYDNDTKLTRFGARDYDAREGRWTTKDPIKFDGGRNFYSYCYNNPIRLVDVSGLKPNDPVYNTPQEAGFAALQDVICNSIGGDIEYGGYIEYDFNTGKYKYTNPIQGTVKNGEKVIDLGPFDIYATVGSYHTHGRFRENYYNYEPSVPDDWKLDYKNNFKTYFGSTDGIAKEYLAQYYGNSSLPLELMEEDNMDFKLLGSKQLDLSKCSCKGLAK